MCVCMSVCMSVSAVGGLFPAASLWMCFYDQSYSITVKRQTEELVTLGGRVCVCAVSDQSLIVLFLLTERQLVCDRI